MQAAIREIRIQKLLGVRHLRNIRPAKICMHMVLCMSITTCHTCICSAVSIYGTCYMCCYKPGGDQQDLFHHAL